jgi:uncharacterized membrane protein YphA (DoxX/SURF4 family)
MFERIFGGFSHWATIPLRVAIGLIFAAHGWQKFSMGLDGVARFFGSVGSRCRRSRHSSWRLWSLWAGSG